MKRYIFSFALTVTSFIILLFILYTRFFSFMEKEFYSNHVINYHKKRLENYASFVYKYHEEQFNYFEKIVGEEAFQNVFKKEIRQQDVASRNKQLNRLTDELIGFYALRIVRAVGDVTEVHFSTLSDDIVSGREGMLVYKVARFNGDSVESALLRSREAQVLYDTESERIVYALPVKEGTGQGMALFYMNRIGLQNYLLTQKETAISDRIRFIGPTALLLNATREQSQVVVNALETNIITVNRLQNIVEPLIRSLQNQQVWLIFTEEMGQSVGTVLPDEALKLPPELKIGIVTSVFMLLFLLFFFIAHLMWHDKMSVLQMRVKKFQYYFLKEFIESKGDINEKVMRARHRLRHEDIKLAFREGLGKLSFDEIEQINLLVDGAWEELIQIVRNWGKSSVPETSGGLVFNENQLEELFAQLISSPTFHEMTSQYKQIVDNRQQQEENTIEDEEYLVEYDEFRTLPGVETLYEGAIPEAEAVISEQGDQGYSYSASSGGGLSTELINSQTSPGVVPSLRNWQWEETEISEIEEQQRRKREIALGQVVHEAQISQRLPDEFEAHTFKEEESVARAINEESISIKPLHSPMLGKQVNFDSYKQPGLNGDLDILMNLKSLLQEMNAKYGMFIEESDIGTFCRFACGLSNDTLLRQEALKESSFFKEYLQQNLCYQVDLTKNSELSRFFSDDDLEHIDYGVYVPLIFHGKKGFLFVGYKDAVDIPQYQF